MARPVRNRKVVNYSQFNESDDADEDYGREKETTKKIRAPPREIKHKKSKNSQEERQESTFLHFKLLNMWQMVRTSEFHDWFRMCSDLWGIEDSDDKLSKSKNDSADDFGSDEDNDFGEKEEDEDGGSDYDDKKAKKGKKGKAEKPGKKSLKRKRGGDDSDDDDKEVSRKPRQ
ncbi:hypothetical protein cypCar_00029533, partial [Cyprinus carpio]